MRVSLTCFLSTPLYILDTPSYGKRTPTRHCPLFFLPFEGLNDMYGSRLVSLQWPPFCITHTNLLSQGKQPRPVVTVWGTAVRPEGRRERRHCHTAATLWKKV